MHRPSRGRNVTSRRALDDFVRRNAQAKQTAEQALRDNPTDVAMMCAVSALYDGMGYFSAARAVAARAIIVAPDSADAHIQHGVVCRHVGDFQAAVTSFRKAITLRPLAVRAYNEIAQMGALPHQNE